MATFPTGDAYTPSFTTTQDTEYRILEVQFRNASQRAGDGGLNAARKVWNIIWTRRDKATSDAIKAFLDARGGWDSFLWTPPSPYDTTQVSVVCNAPVKLTAEEGEYMTISATFTEVY